MKATKTTPRFDTSTATNGNGHSLQAELVSAAQGIGTAKERLAGVVGKVMDGIRPTAKLKIAEKRSMMVDWLTAPIKEGGGNYPRATARALISEALITLGYRARSKPIDPKYDAKAITLAKEAIKEHGDEAASMLLSAYRWTKANAVV